jgi:hypothetical protein
VFLLSDIFIPSNFLPRTGLEATDWPVLVTGGLDGSGGNMRACGRLVESNAGREWPTCGYCGLSPASIALERSGFTPCGG